ncbi:molybdenum cofactor biosynthesis protein MoaC [Halobacteroides halobius DSM 5150]|uniref:Cyclic pyranopterin monophosphate synthase n=1 Tax=Halobacteroides halobius (strain ATCC 35273 / DSM 5150 / MD-1) TaxID=748449 RepID=L0K7C9_HALHC|nr:cyclic pyranopterin monophosphate synthase MoaC [Halobacteroides halobius]AGB41192.1 molybdenum cofactor biosynthesis protein MoaC [Halobacteroides halobius DSM 5150]
MSNLSHFDEAGRSRMVDVGDKGETKRVAVAKGEVKVKAKTLDLITAEEIEKGDVLEVARVAGIMGVKKTSDLIPMCHPLLINGVDVKFNIFKEEARIEIIATAKTTGKTGVEMEALTAVSTAGLTIYDMCKAVDKEIEIGEIKLLKKTGGKSGTYLADELTGKVVAICRSQEKGVAKKEISEVELKIDYGLEGDAHAGDWHRQVSLLAQEDIAYMKEQGLELEAGAFGENLITQGLDLQMLAVGAKLKLNSNIVLEVTQKGKECHDRCAIYEAVGDCIMPRRGIFARVVKGGKLKKNDKVEVLIDD